MAYTYAQAIEITEDFEDLAGTELVMGNRDTEIWYVALAPPGFETRPGFAEAHHKAVTGDASYSYQDPAGQYDVAVIIGQPGSFTTKNIRDYVAEAGIGYNFPG